MKRKMLWLRLILSGGLLLFLLSTVDLQQTITALQHSNGYFLLVALVVALVDRVLMAYKWNILLKAKGIRIPLLNLTATYIKTTFLGLFLPATVGGDALRAYAVSKQGVSGNDVVSSIVVERALGFIALFIFVLVSMILSIFVFGQTFFAGMWNLFWIFLLLLVVSTVGIIVSLNDKFLRRLLKVLEARNIHVQNYRLVAKLGEVYRSYTNYRHNRSQLGGFLVLSLLENLFPLVWTYFLSLAFNIEVPLLYFFILIPIVLVLVRLPISLDGFGIQEGTFVYFLGLIGVDGSQAFLLGFVSHLLAILSVLPGGLLYALGGLGSDPGSRLERQTRLDNLADASGESG